MSTSLPPSPPQTDIPAYVQRLTASEDFSLKLLLKEIEEAAAVREQWAEALPTKVQVGFFASTWDLFLLLLFFCFWNLREGGTSFFIHLYLFFPSPVIILFYY